MVSEQHYMPHNNIIILDNGKTIPSNGKGCLTFPSFQQLQPFRKLQTALAEARARVRSNLRYPRLEGQGDRRG